MKTNTGNMTENLIDNVFAYEMSDKSRGIKLMTHVVAGYPDLETNERLIRIMAENGADLVEIQIPFSDPLADGPTIATANQVALENGITPDDCFRLVERLRAKLHIPLLLMTYTNIPFRIGMDTFTRSCRDAGVSGLIIPDLPFDEGREYLEIVKSMGLYPVPVLSPGIEEKRLTAAVETAAGFIYATLRVGITGAHLQINEKGLHFLNTVRSCSSLPIVAGFGISSLEMIRHLKKTALVDAAVVGSYIIDLFNREGIEAVGTFIRQIKSV